MGVYKEMGSRSYSVGSISPVGEKDMAKSYEVQKLTKLATCFHSDHTIQNTCYITLLYTAQ